MKVVDQSTEHCIVLFILLKISTTVGLVDILCAWLNFTGVSPSFGSSVCTALFQIFTEVGELAGVDKGYPGQ